jgi:hypothetical protein
MSFVGEVWIELDRFEYRFRCFHLDVKLLVRTGGLLSGPVTRERLHSLVTRLLELGKDIHRIRTCYEEPPQIVEEFLAGRSKILASCAKAIDRVVI